MKTLLSKFRDVSIRTKVMLVTFAACLVALFAVAGELYVFQLRQFRQTFAQELRTLSKIMADNCAVALAFNDPKTANEVLSPLAVKPEIKNAALLGGDGKEFATFGGDDECTPPAANDPAGIVERGESWMVVEPVVLDGKRIGTFYMDADFGQPRRELQRLYASVTGAVFAGSLLLVVLLTMQLQKFITRPIQSLATASNAVAKNRDYSVRVTPQGADEVGVLTDAFNQMLAQIQTQDAALQGAQEELREQLKSLQREIVERKRAETARARLTAIIDGTPDFVGSASPTGVALYLNSAARRMIGLEADADISSMNITDFHPGWAARIISTEGLPGAIHDGSWAGETALLHRDGSEIHVSQVIIAHKNAGGGVENFSTVMRDISERKASEEALRVAEHKFRGLVEQLPAITYHAAVGETCAWTYVSPQIFTLLGFTPEEWLASDRLWFDHIHPDDRSIPIEAEAVAMRTGSLVAEYRMFTRGGDLRWFRDQAVFVPGTDQTSHALYGVMMDITEAKAAEASLAELNKRLVDTSRLAGMAEVATGVLHNVGNVLNSVNVSGNLLSERLRGSKVADLAKVAALLDGHRGDFAEWVANDPRGKRIPELVARVAEALLAERAGLLAEVGVITNHIGHIKEIVTMQQNHAKVGGVFEPLEAEALVGDALKMNAGSLAKHRITIVQDYESVPKVLVDKHKVLQILVNLLRNAKQAVDESGREDRHVRVTIQNNGGDFVKIGIHDNGMGIAAENLNRIFSHGFTTKKTGHGFGLHSAALAATEMRGALSVHSDGEGKGATFTLALPCFVPGTDGRG